MVRYIFFILLPLIAFPEIFGKNKVRYKNIEWEVIETEHFEIYYSSKIEDLAYRAARYSENAYKRLSSSLKMDVRNKIPLILFSSHYDFQQTNIILELIDKGVSGFAEVFKKRVVVPFTGSYRELERVINHEVTHIFCFEILYGNLFEKIITNQIFPQVPMWFMEGLASYYEGNLTPEGEMVLKDAVLENALIPLSELSNFSERPYLAYQQSHSLCNFIKEKYGEDVFSIMLRKFAANIKTEKVIKNVLGISQEKLEDEWIESLKEKYWPIVKEEKRPKDYGKRIFISGKNPNFSKGGEIIALFSKEEGIIKLINADGKTIKKIKKGEIKDILAWSMDGCNIAFVGRKERNDTIFIYSVIKGKIIREIDIKDLDEVKSISFSFDPDKILVSGIKDGRIGQFILSISSNELLPIIFNASQGFFLDEKKILFLKEEENLHSIYLFDIEGKGEKILSLPYIHNIFPFDRERFIFIDGSLDIYLCYPYKGIYSKLLDITTGLLSASYNPLKQQLVFSSYHQGREDIYITGIDENRLVWQKLPDTIPFPKEEIVVKTTKKEYKERFTLDYRIGEVFYDSRQGLFTNLSLGGSDILGNNRFVLRTHYSSGVFDFSNIYLGYLNLSKRPSIGIMVFKEQIPYFFKKEKFIDDENGLMGIIEYPFSKTKRIELGGIFGGWKRSYILPADKEKEKKGVYLLSTSIVSDTSELGWTGPISGRRIRLTYERAINPFSSKDILEFDVKKCDFRNYISLTKELILAGRIFYEKSNGRDKRRFPLGGVSIIPIRNSAILRGYNYNEFWADTILSGNLELRIPFVKRLDFALGISIKNIRSVIFYDWAHFSEDKKDQTLSSVGIGFRIVLGFLPIKLDYGWPRDNKGKLHFSIGYDF